MQHRMDTSRLGPAGAQVSGAVEACVHCGICLASCPTYQLLGEEMDSPRGRIYLVKGVLEEEIPLDTAVACHLDRCLGCLACVSACPSGVRYDQMLVTFRDYQERRHRRPAAERLLRRLLMAVLPHPARFRAAARAGLLARPLGRLLPHRLRATLDLLPEGLPPPVPLADSFPAVGRRRARVVLLAGCVQQVLEPDINLAALRVLSAAGVEVAVPRGQGCCGALAMHAGAGSLARALARRNLEALDLAGADAIVTTAAGCGSAMKEYPLLFAGRPEEERARRFAARVRDITECLDQLDSLPAGRLPQATRVAYHDACHLAHAQGIREAPRRLLRAGVENLELVEVPDGEVCCGSAGTYNLEQPELARQLQARKVQAILSTGAEAVVTGNVGCMVQIRAGLRHEGAGMGVFHTIQLLDRAYRAQPLPPAR